MEEKIFTLCLLLFHYCVHKSWFSYIGVPDKCDYWYFCCFFLTLIIAYISQPSLFINCSSNFSFLIFDISSLDFQLRLTLSWHCLKGSSLFCADDFHVNFLCLHQIAIEDIQVWWVCGALSDKSCLEVI